MIVFNVVNTTFKRAGIQSSLLRHGALDPRGDDRQSRHAAVYTADSDAADGAPTAKRYGHVHHGPEIDPKSCARARS